MTTGSSDKYDQPALVESALTLLRADTHEIAAAIKEALAIMAHALRAQRAIAFRYHEEPGEAEGTFEWHDTDVATLLGALYRDTELPDTMAALRRGKTVALAATDGVKDFADLRAVMVEQDTRACLLDPIVQGGRLTWVLVFEWRAHEPSLGAAQFAFSERAMLGPSQIELGGRRVRVPPSFDVDSLRRLLSSLEEAQ